MKILGLAGWSGSGKTTLLKNLLPELIKRGTSVSTIKHSHHNFDIDKKGKDSYIHRAAGAYEVMIASTNRWALMHEIRNAPEPNLSQLISQMTPVDLLIIEGFKFDNYQKIEIIRSNFKKPLLALNDKNIIAIASDIPSNNIIFNGLNIPILDLNDMILLADFISDNLGLNNKINQESNQSRVSNNGTIKHK